MKATTCISGPNDDIIQPKNSTKLDWEVELGIVIGTHGALRREADALNYVAGYCIVNDVSEREFQMASQPVGQGQGLRHLRADRPVARHHRRDHGPAEPRHVAGRERQAHADAATRAR